MLISTVQRSASLIHVATFFFILFSIMVYHRILNTGACAGPCCLSSLDIVLAKMLVRRVFHIILWKVSNELLGQPDIAVCI